MENTAMSIINAQMETLMADYNEVMLDFAEASMDEENYVEKYQKRDKCRLVKVQIDLLKKLMREISNIEISMPMMTRA
ncbi:hypothetical protein IJ425_01170 [bacterium]|nr:hypothetical protein [bacterium]